jgi:putative flippase GtrA
MKIAALFDRTLLKFMLVGVVNTLVGSAIMFFLYNFAGLSYWASSGANYFFTSILSFFLNKYFTFSAKNWSVQMVVLFALTIIAAYVIAYSIAKPLVYALLSAYPEKVRGNVSLLCGMCLFTGINYLGQRFAAFRKTDRTGEKSNVVRSDSDVEKNQG